ncbi:ATP-binding protein [Streptomyces sp. NPDC005955]|uniref:ATP-binding protein n=1 Tax=Streptomyces sp. NPDC005955 TaxID=3364738 RepID=UPI0036A3E336
MNREASELPGPVRAFEAELSSTRVGARLARLLAESRLRSWGLSLDGAPLVVAEPAANAALHGSSDRQGFRLALTVTASALRIEVSDTAGHRVPGTREPDEDAESGRGLLLVEALADHWGVTSGPPPGKTVWAEMFLPSE